MESRTIFVALRDALATLYPEEQSARVIVDDAGLPTLKIAFSSRAETNWHNILATAIHQNRVEALLQIVLSAYSTNVPLLSACGQYYHFISQGGRLEAPEQLPTSAATVQSIKTEGGTAVVGEVNTRGGTFVGRDQHNVNITIQSTLANDPTSNKLRSIVPKPPTDFVPRPTEYNALKELLLADSNAPVGITAAIRGAGGYGKTTLAQALCHDSAIIERFPDGIFWVELAQEPGELTGRVLNLVENLIDRRPGSTTLDAATSELIKAFGDKKLLLVIDDVWQAAHVAPFLQGGPHCTRLITTRINSVLPQDAVSVNVDAMQSGEATQLLGAGIRNVGDALDKLAKRLGEWPLLLRIMNAVLRERIGFGLDLKEAIADVDQELTEEGLGAFQNTASPSERHVSVTATLNVSLRRLPDPDRQLYNHLAIFPEDVDIPLITVAQLWGVSPREAKKLCFRLADLSLLLRFDLVTNTIRLHDVIRTYLCQAQPNLVELHRIFLDSYKLADWTALSTDEPYLWDRLAYHLIEAKRTEELTALFADDRWLQVRVAHDGYLYDGYIADLNQSWQQIHTTVQQQIEAGQMPTMLALSVHHALIRTSINSLSSNYLVPLVVRVLETGLWSPERALSTAYKISDKQKRATMISAILNTHQCNEQQCKVAQTVALEAALAIEFEESQADILAALAPHLGDDLLPQATQAALALSHKESQAAALAGLVPHLSEEQRAETLSQALQAALAPSDEGFQAAALAALAPHLSDDLLPQALQATLALRNEWHQVHTLAALAPHLSEEQRAETLPRALQAALALSDEGSQADILAALAPHLSDDLLPQALQAALALSDEWHQASALAALAPHLGDDLLPRALQAALALRNEEFQAAPLAALAPHLSDDLLPRALEAALAIEFEESQADILAALAPHLSDDLLPRALQATLALRNEWHQANALAALAPHLSEEQRAEILPRALQAALALSDEWSQANILAALAPHLSDDLLPQALQAALAFSHKGHQAAALAALAPHLSDDLLPRALQATLALSDEWHQVHTLAALVPHLSEEQRAEILPRALQAALALSDEWSQANILAALAPHLSDDLLPQALQAALALSDEWHQVRILAALAPHLSDDLLPQALQAALAFSHKGHQVHTLAALAPHLSEEQRAETLPRALQAALAFSHKGHQAAALAALVPHLSEEQRAEILSQALQAALTISDEGHQVHTLAALVPHLSEEQRAETLPRALQAALALSHKGHQAGALAALAPHLSEEQRAEILPRALQAALAIEREESQADILAALAPYLSDDLLPRALQAALALRNEEFQANALAALAPHLSEEQRAETLSQALQAVLAFEFEESEVHTLAAFLVYSSNFPNLPHTIRKVIADHLWQNLPTQQRQAVLKFLAVKSLFESPIIDQNTLAAIARSISEVCFEWRWL